MFGTPMGFPLSLIELGHARFGRKHFKLIKYLSSIVLSLCR